jgi:glucose-6-phosphate isomerase
MNTIVLLAKRTVPELTSHLEPSLTHDSSTNTLIRRYRRIKAGSENEPSRPIIP